MIFLNNYIMHIYNMYAQNFKIYYDISKLEDMTEFFALESFTLFFLQQHSLQCLTTRGVQKSCTYF